MFPIRSHAQCPYGARVRVHWTYVRYIYQRNSAVQVTGVGFAHARPNKSRTSSKFKMAASILFRGLPFLYERENSVHQPSIVLRTGVQQTCLRTNSDRLRVCVRESQSLPLLSLATDALMVRRLVLYRRSGNFRVAFFLSLKVAG